MSAATDIQASKLLSQLSRWTRAIIDWGAIQMLIPSTHRGVRAAGAPPPPPLDPDTVKEIFRGFRRELQSAQGPLGKWMKVAPPVMLISFCLAVAGGFLLVVTPWGGALLGGGLAGTMAAGERAFRWYRDSIMLDLIPARYELRLLLSTSLDQVQQVLRDFQDETRSARAG